MKKLINILLLATLVGFASCDLDKESPDSIPFDKAFSDVGAIEGLERGAYSRLRTAYDLNSMIVPDLQADYAHAVYGFTNTFGPIYQWNFTQESSEVKNAWQFFYGCIGLCNFIIDGIDQHLSFEPTAEQQITLNRIQGNAYLIRAISYSILAERFCGDYDAATAKSDYSGVPLMMGYDTDVKPSRASLYDVYENILKDIEQARTLLKNQTGVANSTTLNIDCVTALKARVLLQMDNYPEALKKANDLIGGTSYSLVDSAEALQEMWTYDKSPETIFQFYASKTELAYQWGYYFYQDNYNGTSSTQNLMMPDYIPTQACVDKYDESDWRRTAYFQNCAAKVQIDGRFILPYIKGQGALAENLVLFKKYPGNPDLRSTSTWNYYNTFKPFRLAEMYLIAAEAAARISGGDAATPLNELRKHRGLPALPTVTLAEVQEERYREMALEGTRLTDLKRWGQGMTRGKAQEGLLSETGGNPWFSGSYVTEVGASIEKEKDNYMFVWPIPASEIFANQQLAGQQNPGWIR